MTNPTKFRAMLDQSEMVLAERLKDAPDQMLASTWVEIWNRAKDENSVSAPFGFIDQCGPALQGMAVLALLQAIASELCRRKEKEE